MKKKQRPNATGSLRELTADALAKVSGGYIILVGVVAMSKQSPSPPSGLQSR
jgi:hypothetical protein